MEKGLVITINLGKAEISGTKVAVVDIRYWPMGLDEAESQTAADIVGMVKSAVLIWEELPAKRKGS